MGIQQLNKYMKQNYQWEHNKIQLSNCSLVLDGNCVSYSLSRRAELDWKFGGEYPALKRETEKFIKSLIQQNVGPIYVIFDGLNPEDKLETSLQRKKKCQDTLVKCLSGERISTDCLNPLMVIDVFSKTLEQYKHNGTVVVYKADGEADGIAATFANKYKCHLVSDDFDFFIFPLDVGFIPFSKLHWTRPGSPVTGSVYKRDVFAASLNISPDLVLAIPAIAGNDIAPNLVISTALKYEIKAEGDSPNYRGKDLENIIAFMRGKTMSELQHTLRRCSGEVLHKFTKNLDKVKKMYEIELSFDEDEFRMSCVHKTKCGSSIPQWIVERYRDQNFGMIEVLTRAIAAFPAIADDSLSKPSYVELSRCIRQVAYGIMDQHQPVVEVIRKGHNLEQDEVVPVPSAMTIYDQHRHPMEAKIKVIFDTLLCNPSTFSSIDQEWYLPIASICFWSKGTNIPKDDIQLKALVLCFAICYDEVPAVHCQPYFDISTLHLYTQWQCTYYDAILLNQVLALPLPYLSPATIFDGKRVTYYSQRSTENFQLILDKCDIETKTLYDTILHIVYANI